MEREEDPELDSRSVVSNVLCEFLEVAVHLILYVREIYPAGIFEKRKKYNVPVQMSCHPELNQYILDVLHGIKPCLEKDEVERICVVIMDKDYRPTERFVFEIGSPEDISFCSPADRYLFHAESALRSFLLKISVCDAMLKPNPPDCRFSILVFTKQSAALRMEQEDKTQAFPWLNVDKDETAMNSPSIIPLKSTSSGVLKAGNMLAHLCSADFSVTEYRWCIVRYRKIIQLTTNIFQQCKSTLKWDEAEEVYCFKRNISLLKLVNSWPSSYFVNETFPKAFSSNVSPVRKTTKDWWYPSLFKGFSNTM